MDFSSPLYCQINDGLSRALFVSAWASAEENAGRTYPGSDLMDVAPETPDYARLHGAYVIGQIEASNRMPLASLFAQACKADNVDFSAGCEALGRDWDPDSKEMNEALSFEEYARDFGHCLGMMSLGSGVSWFDDHARFEVDDGLNPPREFTVPYTEFYLDEAREPSEVRPLMVPAKSPNLQPSR